jgi:hypothetical protein
MVLARRTTSVEGQLGLSLPPLQNRPGLVHMLSPEYLGVVSEDYADISDQTLRQVAPSNLRKWLIDVEPSSDNAESYPAYGFTAPRTAIALTPTDFDVLAHYPGSIKKRGYNRTLKARAGSDDIDTDMAAAYRSGAHALEGYQRRMEAHVALTITPQISLVTRFHEAALYSNLSRIGNREEMQTQFRDLTSLVIDGMLVAIRNQRGWNGNTSEKAARAIVKAMILPDKPAIRARNTHALLDVAYAWYGHKNALFAHRLFTSQQQVNKAYSDAAKYSV